MTNDTRGNNSLRSLSPLAVRSRLRSEFARDPVAMKRWREYADEYREREATYNSASVRGFSRGERVTNLVR